MWVLGPEPGSSARAGRSHLTSPLTYIFVLNHQNIIQRQPYFYSIVRTLRLQKQLVPNHTTGHWQGPWEFRVVEKLP